MADSAGPPDAAGQTTAGVRYYMLGDQIKDQLLQRILGGELAPGARIVETRVARELGISQGPVREALRDLAALGLVELLPYRGARVCRPSIEEIQEAMQIRGELEALAAAEAARRITPACLQDLRGLVGELTQLARTGQVHEYVVKDVAFHHTMVQAAQNRTLERLWSLLQPLAYTYLSASMAGLPASDSPDWHSEIVDGLASGDPAKAVAAVRDHAERVQDRVRGTDDGVPTVRAGLPEAEGQGR